MRRSSLVMGLAGAAGLLLSACSTTVQTSSGEDYLSRGPFETAAAQSAGLDAGAFERAASVEPLMRFPARIGIARMEGGRLTPIPEAEMQHWTALAEETESTYGELVPLNLLSTAMVLPPELLAAVDAPRHQPPSRAQGWGQRQEPVTLGSMQRASMAIEAIRLGAARQHLDSVFIYEVYGQADLSQSAASLANLTLLGAFIAPGTKVDAVGAAEGILVDVRNGYPYLSSSETVTREGLAASARAGKRGDLLREAAQEKAVADMAESLRPAMARLAVELGNLPAGEERLAQRP
ncbi:hypothetical protein [Parvularcula maris]|uniref:Rhombotarget lipoprotein n=1 Tax=Parvularcula maris TaxID=2965077 RepID=A0A9X2RJQ9_9PROT|nr:hypothetical protein [Parvularcula maris]MCQ8184922.1 hypothetical protein [Parvularcula maris]